MPRLVPTSVLVLFVCALAAPAASQPVAADGPHLDLFGGLDGSKQPQDLGVNANMGVRASANLGVPLSRRFRLGVQAGVGVNLSDAAVAVLEQVDGTSRRTQTFLTAGLFGQAGADLTWALGYDLLVQSYFDDFTLGQLRGRVGYALDASNEVGVWFTKSLLGDEGALLETAVRLDPISQANAYLTHTWPTAARTTFWVGVAAGHDNVVLVLPPDSRDDRVLVYGAELMMPLSDHLAVTGAANFLTPTASGTVDAFLGFTWLPGGTARARTAAARPGLGVANNPTFAVNLRR